MLKGYTKTPKPEPFFNLVPKKSTNKSIDLYIHIDDINFNSTFDNKGYELKIL